MAKRIIYFILISFLPNFIILEEQLKGIFLLNSFRKNYINNRPIIHFRFRTFIKSTGLDTPRYKITPIEPNIYTIESLQSNKLLSLDNINHKLKLIYKNNAQCINNNYWNIIKINNNSEYLIQNNQTKNFLESNSYHINSGKCVEDISKIINKNDYKNIPNSFKFKLYKLYEVAETKPEYMKYIDDEPVDVVIKYIDISDEKLNRTGVNKISKYLDHGEIKYSVRSIYENIPWVRKIIIVLPNEKVKYFKPIEEIKDRIVYIKDKDLIGFDTANEINYFLNIWNLKKFNVSDNIISMDDDYFIGKPIKKSDFFYYDEEQKKVLPCIVSGGHKFVNKEFIYREYNKMFSNRYRINPQTPSGWQLFSYASYKLLLDNYPEPLIDAGFTHNALPININDVKEIYDLVKNKYKYAKELFNSKKRSIYHIQFQTLYNSYALNIKKRKVHEISSLFIDLSNVRSKTKEISDLFVINTSGDITYRSYDYKNLLIFLESKFNKPTPYEIINNTMEYKNIYSNTSNIKYKPNFNIKEKINEYENENNKIKIKSHYLKEQNKIFTISKYHKKRKKHNYLFAFIFGLIIALIIITILIVYKFKCLKFLNYSPINEKKVESISNIDDNICINNN